jgi:TolA-binding protein
MQPEFPTIVQLFNLVSDRIGDGVSPERMARYERQVHTIVCKRKHVEGPRPLQLSLVGASAALALTLSLLIGIGDAEPLLFKVGEKQAVGIPGMPINTDREETKRLSFDQGSTFLIYPDSRLQVLKSDEESVNLDLESGALLANIQGNGRTTWTVSAGGYQITVLGTEFKMEWYQERRVLDVKVAKGTVLVRGDDIGDAGIEVEKGKHFRANREKGLLAIKTIDSVYYNPNEVDLVRKEPASPSGDPTFTTNGERLLPPERVTSTQGTPMTSGSAQEIGPNVGEDAATSQKVSHPSRQHPSRPSADRRFGIKGRRATRSAAWLKHYNSEDYHRALEEAMNVGIDRLFASLGLNKLWKLIHAARASGSDAVAARGLIACRKRFKGRKKAKRAAFLLGKIYSDKLNDPKVASEWFHQYLLEDPEGPLAEEALGRLVVIFDEMGSTDNAQRAATTYRTNYPNGSFVSNVRVVLDE